MTTIDWETRILTKNRALILVAVVSLVCFFAIAHTRSGFGVVNLAVNTWTVTIQTPSLTQAANIINYFFDTMFLLVVTLPIVGVLIYKRQIKNGIMLLVAMGADAVLLEIFKTVIVSPRPPNSLIVENGYSFPSGHLTSTIVLLGMLTYFAWQSHRLSLKVGFGVVTAALGVLVGFDRLYLNAHWLSDVLAAPFLALFVVATSILVVEALARWYNKRRYGTQSTRPKGEQKLPAASGTCL